MTSPTHAIGSSREVSYSRRESKASYSPHSARQPSSPAGEQEKGSPSPSGSPANVRRKLAANHQRNATHLQLPPHAVEMASLGKPDDEKQRGKPVLFPAPPIPGQLIEMGVITSVPTLRLPSVDLIEPTPSARIAASQSLQIRIDSGDQTRRLSHSTR